MRAAIYVILLAAAALLSVGCERKPAAAPPAKAEEHHAEHKAFHGGCLNAINSCDNGHAEVRVDGDVLTLWFVGGGNDTGQSVRVPDAEITLAIKTADGAPEKSIVLKAKPNALAEEKVGDCATFEGQAEWLKGIKEFHATGSVTFKGKKENLRIDYPDGYDPD